MLNPSHIKHTMVNMHFVSDEVSPTGQTAAFDQAVYGKNKKFTLISTPDIFLCHIEFQKLSFSEDIFWSPSSYAILQFKIQNDHTKSKHKQKLRAPRNFFTKRIVSRTQFHI